jgi:hypothetical protein
VANAVAALTDKAQLLVQKLCEKNDELDEERAVAEQALADQVATLTASSLLVVDLTASSSLSAPPSR